MLRIVCSFLILTTVAGAAAVKSRATPGPRLAVLISVDQMRGDYLERFAPHFGPGGFRRFMDGRWYQQCYHRHGITKTGPGHATMLTGVHANLHGIIGNEWRLPTWPAPEEVNCVEDRESALLGRAPAAVRSPGGLIEAKSGRSPRHLLAPTVGDQLKDAYGARAKVFGVAGKDRAAILPTGRRADGAFWFIDGRVVTSTYYREALPAYFEAFNAEQRAEKQFGRVWDRLLDPAVYEAVQGPDDAAGESENFGLGRTFPRRLDGGTAEVSRQFRSAFEHSPFDNVLVADAVRAVVQHEHLGEDDDAPDLLVIGFSQPDRLGHAYGPDSHEIMDSLLRLDRTLAELFAFIDQEVGLANCVFVLTGDHGAAPLPERQLAKGVPAGRIRGAEFDQAVFPALDARFGVLAPDQRWAVREGLGYRVNPAAAAAKNVTVERVAEEIASAVRTVPAVVAAYTRDEMVGPEPRGEIPDAMRLSFHRERSPDVVFVLKPYFMDRSERTGQTHGSPYAYDQHVPLCWFGTGIEPVRSPERVAVEDIAATLAGLLKVPPPGSTQGRALF